MMMTLAPAAHADCEDVANADAALKPGARVFVGELHGTSESPRVFGALVCRAAKQQVPVRVGLELPFRDERAIAAYVGSGGTLADRDALLGGAFWHRAFQDGRSSVAMFQLIDVVRVLRQRGADVAIVPFDEPASHDRDRAMADRILAAIARAPQATWLLYAGNLHARKARHAQFATTTTFTAMHLVAHGVPLTSLDARYGAGSAWVCFGTTPADCRPNLIGKGEGHAPAVVLARSPDGAYDGLLDVGVATFSPPAAVPMTKAEEARARSLERERAARAAYDAKEFARCGELYEALARELASAEHAYSAACCHARAGQIDRAFAALSAAIDGGFRDAVTLGSDDDLAALRADARWKPLVARLPATPSAK